jgi:hypothetical protein
MTAAALIAKPVELQFNSSGFWGKGPRFDMTNAPDELLQAADLLARVCDHGLKMRVVYCDPDTGRATNDALMHWDRQKGWFA